MLTLFLIGLLAQVDGGAAQLPPGEALIVYRSRKELPAALARSVPKKFDFTKFVLAGLPSARGAPVPAKVTTVAGVSVVYDEVFAPRDCPCSGVAPNPFEELQRSQLAAIERSKAFAPKLYQLARQDGPLRLIVVDVMPPCEPCTRGGTAN